MRLLYWVVRGGSWNGGAAHCRAARRYGFDPEYCNYFIGFRCARRVK